MKKILFIIFVLLAVFIFLIFKSRTVLTYGVTEVRGGRALGSPRIFFDKDAFIDYLTDLPDRLSGRIFSRAFDSYRNMGIDQGLQNRQGELKMNEADAARQVKQLMESYRKLFEESDIKE
jgi:hypothetical protein